MATKKKATISKPRGPECWEEDHEKYPCKRGVCDFCGQRDDIKLSFDQIHWICINDSACYLRWKKSLNK